MKNPAADLALCVLCALFLTGCGANQPRCPKPEPTSPPRQAAPETKKEAPPADEDSALVLRGTPEIPQELKDRLNRYLNTRSASLGDLNAAGDAALIETRFAQTSQVHLVSRPGGARRQLTFREEPARSPSFVPQKSSKVVFLSDKGGDEQYRLFELDLESAAVRALSPKNSRVTGYLWAPGGKKLAYANNARNGKDFDIYISDLGPKPPADPIMKVEGYFYPLDFSSNGRLLIVGEYISISESKLHLLDLDTGKAVQISPEAAGSYLEAVFDRGDKSILAISDRDGEFIDLYRTDLEGKKWTKLTEDIKWDVEALAASPAKGTIAFTVNENGYSRLYTLNKKDRPRPIEDVPPGIIRGLRFAEGKDILGFSLARPTTSTDAFSYDFDKKKLTRWTESEMGGLKPENLIEPRPITYKSFDGLEIPSFYFPVKGPGPHPVVISIHGGPEAQARPYFSPLLQLLASELGIAVLMPNVRGSYGYGKTYVTLDNAEKREDSVKDIGALLDWIKEQPELDEERVGVTGGSYGGYMVLAGLIHYPERIRAGVEVVGISNFVTFLENTKSYRRDLRRVEYGDERDPKMREFLTKISPVNSADKIDSALFVAHGANDPRVPVGEAEQIVDAVRNRGRDVWYMLARNEGHGFARKENRDTFSLLSVLFFEKHLVGED